MLQLTVYAFARCPHIDSQLFLGNVNLRSEIGGEVTESSRQPNLEGQQDGFFEAVAGPPDPLAEQRDEFHRDPRLALEKVQEIVPADNEKFALFPRRRIGGAGEQPAAPMTPKPPAFETAAASRHIETLPIPARMIGYLIPKKSQIGVCSMM